LRGAARPFWILEEAEGTDAQMSKRRQSYRDDVNDRGRGVRNANLFALGIAANVTFHDPDSYAIPTSAGRSTRVSASDRAAVNADCIALLRPHCAYGLDRLASRASLISEARDAFGSRRAANPIPQ
jgi:hypothetical protein